MKNNMFYRIPSFILRTCCCVAMAEIDNTALNSESIVGTRWSWTKSIVAPKMEGKTMDSINDWMANLGARAMYINERMVPLMQCLIDSTPIPKPKDEYDETALDGFVLSVKAAMAHNLVKQIPMLR